MSRVIHSLKTNRSESEGWKPAQVFEEHEAEPASPSSAHNSEISAEQAVKDMERFSIEQRLRQKIHVKKYGKRAGAIMDAEEVEKFGFASYMNSDNIYAPFASDIDWDVAKWVKLRGPSSTAATELLEIPEVCYLHFF